MCSRHDRNKTTENFKGQTLSNSAPASVGDDEEKFCCVDSVREGEVHYNMDRASWDVRNLLEVFSREFTHKVFLNVSIGHCINVQL